MKLTKQIPATTLTITAQWCKKDYLGMSPTHRRIRRSFEDPMSSCFWCGIGFADGDKMSLARFDTAGNKVLCGACADELLASEQGRSNENADRDRDVHGVRV